MTSYFDYATALFSKDDTTRHVAQEVLLAGAVGVLAGIVIAPKVKELLGGDEDEED